jgi:glutamyl-tRNA reductase
VASLVLVAITHQSAPFALLERVALSSDDCTALASSLCRGTAGVSEAVVLSTCNRTEIYVAGRSPHHAAVVDALASLTGADRTELAAAALKAVDDDASLHLLRVAAGLESRVVGEGEILGQVRAAYGRAAEHGTVGPRLSGLFRWAASTGRRARRASFASGAALPSLASIALDEAAASPGFPAVLLVGAGSMAAAVAGELTARRVAYRVCARRPDRAAHLARAAGVVPFDGLGGALDQVDVVVCATSARSPVLSVADLAAALQRRRGRPLTVVDLGLPRNVAPAAGAIAGVRLLDLAALSVDRGDLHLRRGAHVVAMEHRRYLSWLAGQAAGADIGRLRAHLLCVCRAQVVRDAAGGAMDAATVERLARSMAGVLAHRPTVVLKDLVAHGDTAAAAAVLSAFGLEPSAGSDRPDADDPVAVAS